MTLIHDFSIKFDVLCETHIQWLADLTKESESPGPGLVNVWNANPMGVKVEGFKQMQETAEIHFLLLAKYATAIFKNGAYILPAHSLN